VKRYTIISAHPRDRKPFPPLRLFVLRTLRGSPSLDNELREHRVIDFFLPLLDSVLLRGHHTPRSAALQTQAPYPPSYILLLIWHYDGV